MVASRTIRQESMSLSIWMNAKDSLLASSRSSTPHCCLGLDRRPCSIDQDLIVEMRPQWIHS